jgi:hypothetical protein
MIDVHICVLMITAYYELQPNLLQGFTFGITASFMEVHIIFSRNDIMSLCRISSTYRSSVVPICCSSFVSVSQGNVVVVVSFFRFVKEDEGEENSCKLC